MGAFSFDQVTAALVSLLIGTLLGKEITRFLYKPKVIIRYRDVSPLETDDGYFISTNVANLGRTVATNCIGTLTLFGIDKHSIMHTHEADPLESLPDYPEEKIDLDFPRFSILDPNTFREINNVSLCWARLGNPQCIDINPGMMTELDICKVHLKGNKKYIIFPSEDGWRKLRVRIEAKPLKGRVLICPSNEFPTPVNFEFSLNEEGNPVFRASSIGMFDKIRNLIFRRDYYFN